jgi:hypothetical protein
LRAGKDDVFSTSDKWALLGCVINIRKPSRKPIARLDKTSAAKSRASLSYGSSKRIPTHGDTEALTSDGLEKRLYDRARRLHECLAEAYKTSVLKIRANTASLFELAWRGWHADENFGAVTAVSMWMFRMGAHDLVAYYVFKKDERHKPRKRAFDVQTLGPKQYTSTSEHDFLNRIPGMCNILLGANDEAYEKVSAKVSKVHETFSSNVVFHPVASLLENGLTEKKVDKGYNVDLTLEIDISDYSLKSSAVMRLMFVSICMLMDYSTTCNMNILMGRHFRTPCMKTGSLSHLICPGSQGDAEGTFSQAMTGVTFFSTMLWKRNLLESEFTISGKASIVAKAKYVSDDISARVRVSRPLGWPWKKTRDAIVAVSAATYNANGQKTHRTKCVIDVLTDKIGPQVSRVNLPPGISRSTPAIYDVLGSPEMEGLSRYRASAINEMCGAVAKETRDPVKARALYKEVAYHLLALQRTSPSESFYRTAARLPATMGQFCLPSVEYYSGCKSSSRLAETVSETERSCFWGKMASKKLEPAARAEFSLSLFAALRCLVDEKGAAAMRCGNPSVPPESLKWVSSKKSRLILDRSLNAEQTAAYIADDLDVPNYSIMHEHGEASGMGKEYSSVIRGAMYAINEAQHRSRIVTSVLRPRERVRRRAFVQAVQCMKVSEGVSSRVIESICYDLDRRHGLSRKRKRD